MNAWQEIAAHCPKDRPIAGAEVGVWNGKTSAALLLALPSLYLYMIDDWAVRNRPEDRNRCSTNAHIGKSHNQMMGAIRDARDRTAFAADRRSILHKDMLSAVAHFKPCSLWFAFLDADHTYAGTLKACKAYWPLIQSGGFLCGHDWGHPSRDWNVARAVREFRDAVDRPCLLVDDGVWIIEKGEA